MAACSLPAKPRVCALRHASRGEHEGRVFEKRISRARRRRQSGTSARPASGSRCEPIYGLAGAHGACGCGVTESAVSEFSSGPVLRQQLATKLVEVANHTGARIKSVSMRRTAETIPSRAMKYGTTPDSTRPWRSADTSWADVPACAQPELRMARTRVASQASIRLHCRRSSPRWSIGWPHRARTGVPERANPPLGRATDGARPHITASDSPRPAAPQPAK